MMTRTITIPAAIAGLVAAIGLASADDRRPPRRGPPPEAIAACDGKSAGDTCSVTLHDRTIDGECRAAPDGAGPLACAPDHPPGPPPEAVTACDGKSAGDACNVTHDGHSFDGSCRTGPDGNGPLACAPAR